MEHIVNNASELLLLLFLIITFLQSGVDKVVDWKGNLSWLNGHFSKTPLAGMVPVLLATVTLAELTTGICCGIGFFQMLSDGATTWAFYGAILSCISLLMLLFGQRMAKDYVGAKTIVVYFVPAVFLVFLLQP